MKTEHRELRKRLLEEFPLYARYALKIRTKQGTIEPLVLNEAQQILNDAIESQMATEGKVRIIILKGRQQGLSTYVGGRLYFRVSQRKAKKAMVLTHHSDSTKALFDMTKRYHDKCPDLLKPQTKYNSRRELTFANLDSSYIVATAGADSVGRGETLTHVHASEVAFWNANNSKELLNGLLQAVPDTEGTEVYLESTANGVTGIFHDMWDGAVKGENGFIPVFIPWFIQQEYRLPVTEDFERSPEEQELVEKYGLDDEQLMFRRRKIAQNGIDLFKQEYPCEPDEAFLTTGRPVFNPDVLQKRIPDTPEPTARLALEGYEGNWKWENHVRGELTLYHPHVPGEQYVIGADVAMGVRGGDFSVAQVLDAKKRQVAVWRGHVHPDHYATVLYHLGLFFNEARIIVESNNHGLLTAVRLGKDLAYPNVYTEEPEGDLVDHDTLRIGFKTTVKTKPLIIDKLRAALRENEVELNDKTTIRELLTYIVTDTGSMEAEPGKHDDCVMSLALANHIHEGAFVPVEVGDDYYIEMV